MPRRPSLTPVRERGRARPWKVSVPKSLSEDGKPHREFYRTKLEAEARCVALRNRMSRGRQDDLVDLLPPGVGLRDAVEFYLSQHENYVLSPPFGVAYQEFVEMRADDLRPKTVQEYTSLTSRFEPLSAQRVSEITTSDLESQMREMSYSNRKRFRRILRTFFAWASRPQRSYCLGDPAEHIELGRPPIRDIAILSNSEVRQLFSSGDPQVLTYVALAIFAGIRPSEIMALKWSDIDLQELHVEVTHTKTSRTSRRRFVEISNNLAEWIQVLREFAGKDADKVVPMAKETLYDRFKTHRAKVGLERWPSDIARHTFASNHLAHHRDMGRLMIAMGHRSTRMLDEHYLNAITRSSAARFWDIRPHPSITSRR